MPTYKLFYVNARGRAEIVRLTFAQADVEYEDIRFGREEWPKYKLEAPFGTMPYLEVDGVKVGQSMACARYIARQQGLMGKDAFEEAHVNALCDAFTDMFEHGRSAKRATSEEDRNTALEKLTSLVTTVEDYLKNHNSGEGFLVGSDVTLADLRAFDIFWKIRANRPDLAGVAPLLNAHCDRVGALPRIKAWVEKRPDTEM